MTVDIALYDLAPMTNTVVVASEIAGQDQAAAGPRHRLEGGGLLPSRRGHGLVEVPEALVDLTQRDLGQSELGERGKLEIGIMQPASQHQRGFRVTGRECGIQATLHPGEVEIPSLGRVGLTGHKVLSSGEPSLGGGLVSMDRRVLVGQPQRDPHRAGHVPGTRNNAYACTRASMASAGRSNHHRARASPSNASAVVSCASAASKLSLARCHAPWDRASSPAATGSRAAGDDAEATPLTPAS